MAVASRIAELGSSPDAIARAAGTSGATVRALMRGSRWPHLATRSRLELALGWAAGELERRAAGREQPPTPLDGYGDTELIVELLRRGQERDRLAGR